MLNAILKRSDLMLAVGIMSVLMIMVLPVPPIILDLGLTLSLTVSVIILLISAYILRPLEFSAFPSILLVTTLFRLALNIASTRLILLKGDEGLDAAGKVIMAFGQFVVGGNYAVGIIVFLILVIINFVVITKGSGRIAEVAARFTLDAMPGKQMSIDADLNAGLIDEKEARRRREEIRREADFYGAMDGASKFVRGDAIAGLIIMVINIVGGLLIGVLQKNLKIADALEIYTILTIGDALIAQIPSLIVSTAAGIIVSRAAAESNLGVEVIGQLFSNPKVLGTASGILAVLGLIPGLPHVPFLIMSAIVGTSAYLMRQLPEVKKEEPPAPEPTQPETYESLLSIDPITLEIGYGLIPLVEEGGTLLARIKGIRRQLVTELGFIVPPVHIKDNLSLKPTGYSVLIKGVEVATGEVMLNKYLAISPGSVLEDIEGIDTVDPAFGLPAKWIDDKLMDRAQLAGYTVVDVATVITTHLTEIIKNHAHELLGKQDVQKLIDNLATTQPKVVEELIPSLMTVGNVQKVLHNLIRERVPIRDLQTILETLADYAPTTKDLDLLTEYVRQALSRSITKNVQGQDGSITVMVTDPKIEKQIADAVQVSPHGAYLSLDPSIIDKIADAIKKAYEDFTSRGYQPILLCSPVVRRFLKKIADRVSSSITVLSHAEITANAKIFSLGTVKYEG